MTNDSLMSLSASEAVTNSVPLLADEENELITASYTLIKRTRALLGHLTLNDLFTSPWEVLISRITPERPEIAPFLKNAEQTIALLHELEGHPGMSFEQLVKRGYDSSLEPVYLTLRRLWREQGILLPTVVGTSDIPGDILEEWNAPVRYALDALLKVTSASNLTYSEIYQKGCDDLPEEACSVLAAAREVGVLLNTPNYRCCRAFSMMPATCVDTSFARYCEPPASGTGCNIASESCA